MNTPVERSVQRRLLILLTALVIPLAGLFAVAPLEKMTGAGLAPVAAACANGNTGGDC
ncbi:MAG: hypothetical protein KF753_10485 [Caldilineaceae bacterium]|nr:hypothetical protein [Caldilineaceae bacterium]